MPTIGPRRLAWERLKRQDEALRREILQFNRDLASYNENNRWGVTLPINPREFPPPLPPMPGWEE